MLLAFFAVWSVVAASIIGALVGRMYERNAWQQKLIDRVNLDDGAPRRLTARDSAPMNADQVTQALDAIAVEVERLGEGQRFLTKLLAEQRTVRADSGRTASPIPGSMRSPVPPAS